VVTLFDADRRLGGMAHYTRPLRERNRPSTALYAAPAIVWLVRCFLGRGARPEQLEAQVFGGAANGDAPGYVADRHHQNVQVGLELLDKQGIHISTMDVGGHRGRKVVFDTGNGESAVVRVSRIRADDWYPDPEALEARR